MSDAYHDDPIEYVEEVKKEKSPKKYLFLLIAVALGTLGQTYAANINLGSGNLEFGQGMQVFTACSGNTPITVSATSAFQNGASAGLYLSKIKFSNIPASCYGYDFTVKTFDSVTASSALNYISSSASSANIYNNSGTFTLNKGSGYSISSLSTSSFEIVITTPNVQSKDIQKFTLESSAHIVYTCATGGTCNLGDTGPGGGIIIITPSTAGGDGKYYEIANQVWGHTNWCNVTNSLLGTGTAIGTGKSNTALMASSCTDHAAMDTLSFTQNGYSDWFLPSKSELNAAYAQRSLITSTPGGPSPHFSSSEASTTNLWGQTWSDGRQYSDTGKGGTGNWYVVAVRSFSA